MTNTGCLNLRGKNGSQSSITVRCVYLPASFFNACSSDYLRTERLFLQRPFASQMVSPVFSHFAAVLLEIRNIAFFIIRFSNLTKGRVFSSESKQNVRFRLFQNGCNRRNDSYYSFLLLPKSVAANNKNLYRTASLFERQALFADAFGCLNSWFNPGNLSRRLLRRNLLSNIGFFTLNQLSANGKSQPRTSDRKSLIGNRRDHYDFMRVLPRVKRLRAENHCCSSLLCSDSLFVFFSPAAFYAQGPRMDRQRVFSIFSSGNSSFRDCFYYFQSAGIRFEALLFNLNLRVSHFCNSKSRKQSAKHRHCSTQEICKFGFFVPTKNQCEKADCQPAHKFISRSNFHFFLRVLGLDFCLTAQILPSTPETNFVRMG